MSADYACEDTWSSHTCIHMLRKVVPWLTVSSRVWIFISSSIFIDETMSRIAIQFTIRWILFSSGLDMGQWLWAASQSLPFQLNSRWIGFAFVVVISVENKINENSRKIIGRIAKNNSRETNCLCSGSRESSYDNNLVLWHLFSGFQEYRDLHKSIRRISRHSN